MILMLYICINNNINIMKRPDLLKDLLRRQMLIKETNKTIDNLLESLSDEHIFNQLSTDNKRIYNVNKDNIQLKGGERLLALVDTIGVSNCYNMPERIEISKGTIIVVPYSGTRFGDVFTNLESGNVIKHLRGHFEGEKRTLVKDDIIGLSGGYITAPYSLGLIKDDVWQIL